MVGHLRARSGLHFFFNFRNLTTFDLKIITGNETFFVMTKVTQFRYETNQKEKFNLYFSPRGACLSGKKYRVKLEELF